VTDAENRWRMNADITSAIERFIVDEIIMGDRQTRIASEDSLISSGVIDSLALLRLIGFIEERFDVTIEDQEVIPDNFETLSAIESYVSQKI
jgi:acyl carrier protein